MNNYQICKSDVECLENLKYNDKLAIAVSRQYALHNAHVSDTEIFCFDKSENIFNFFVSMHMKQNLDLHEKINGFIQRVLAVGLMKKWITDTQRRVRNNYDRERSTSPESAVPLSLEHWSLGFVLYILFMSLSFIAFYMEMLVYKNVCSNKSSKFWKWADLVMTGKRTFLLLKENNVVSRHNENSFNRNGRRKLRRISKLPSISE